MTVRHRALCCRKLNLDDSILSSQLLSMPTGVPLSSGDHGTAAANAHPMVSVTDAGIQLHEFDGNVFHLSSSNPEGTGHEDRSVSSPGASSTAASPRAKSTPQEPGLVSSPLLQLPPGALTTLRSGSPHSRVSAISNRINLWKPRVYNHWKSPILMVFFYSIGFTLSIAHCVIYRSLDGKIVGSSYDQEQNLRYVRLGVLVMSRLQRICADAREDMAPHSLS